MNRDVFEGKWKQLRGDVKKFWGKLTDDDLDQINGDRDKFIGRLQERYGYSKQQAELELDRGLKEFQKSVKS